MKEISLWGILCLSFSFYMIYQVFLAIIEGREILVVPLILIATIPALVAGLLFTLTGYCGRNEK